MRPWPAALEDIAVALQATRDRPGRGSSSLSYSSHRKNWALARSAAWDRSQRAMKASSVGGCGHGVLFRCRRQHINIYNPLAFKARNGFQLRNDRQSPAPCYRRLPIMSRGYDRRMLRATDFHMTEVSFSPRPWDRAMRFR